MSRPRGAPFPGLPLLPQCALASTETVPPGRGFSRHEQPRNRTGNTVSLFFFFKKKFYENVKQTSLTPVVKYRGAQPAFVISGLRLWRPTSAPRGPRAPQHIKKKSQSEQHSDVCLAAHSQV